MRRAETRADLLRRDCSQRSWLPVRGGGRHGHRASSANVQAWYPFTPHSPLGHRGVLIGRDYYGGPFVYDPWLLYGDKVLHDPNIMIIGKIGFAKSSLAKTFASRSRLFGRRVEIIDRKREYGPLIRAHGGVSVRLGPDVCINPLERLGSEQSRKSMLRTVARALTGRELTGAERVGLSAALEIVDRRKSGDVVIPDVLAELKNPSDELAKALNLFHGARGPRRQTAEGRAPVPDCNRAREEMREVAYALEDLTTGPLAGMFDGPTSTGAEVWGNPVICIDISELQRLQGDDEKVALSIAMVSATAFLEAKRLERERAGGREKVLRINDEAWKVLGVPGIARWFQQQLKLSRSTGVSNWLLLHKLRDLSSTGDDGSETVKLAEGLLADCGTRVVYRQDSNELPLTVRALHLTSSEEQWLTRLREGQGLWRVGGRAFLVEHVRAQCEVDMVDTDEAMREA